MHCLIQRRTAKHRGHILTFIFALAVCSVPAFAQDDLRLSGVMQGDKPAAIVNDTIVPVGGTIGNYKVIEVTSDHVVFEGPSGRVTKFLKEPEAKPVKPAPKKPQAVGATPVRPPAVAKNAKSEDAARKRLNTAMDYLRQGDDLLKGELKFERLYAKAVSLCDDAQREAQAALGSLSEDAARNQVKDLVARIRKAKETIVHDRANFNTRVRSLIAAKQLITGMTAQDVLSSWGPPLIKTSPGTIERWTYQDNNGYQKELTFNQGILVAF